jgi:predicted dehydrogenase
VSEQQLQAVVIGAGWAGEGHTRALQHSGVRVQAICARQWVAVEAVAKRLGVPEASVDWRRTLERVKPDIVSLATPASFRREVVEAAAGLGCHLLSEKPLAVDGARARDLLDIVRQAKIKHAYAATGCYDPGVAWLAELVRDGAIGELREIDVVFRYPQPLPDLLPWTWMDTLAAGGGLLNNGLPHSIGMLERIIGGPIVRVMGAVRAGRRRAPVVPGIHDYRQIWSSMPPPEAAAELEWRDCDADSAGYVLSEYAPSGPDRATVQVTGTLSSLVTGAWPPNGCRLYGDRGVLLAEGATLLRNIARQSSPDSDPEPMPIPQRLFDAMPAVPGAEKQSTEANWAALVRDLAADIEGRSHEPYLTFYDGWRYQEAIDAIRSGEGWRELPA